MCAWCCFLTTSFRFSSVQKRMGPLASGAQGEAPTCSEDSSEPQGTPQCCSLHLEHCCTPKTGMDACWMLPSQEVAEGNLICRRRALVTAQYDPPGGSCLAWA